MPSDQPIADKVIAEDLKPCPNPWCMSSKRPTFESFGPRDAHEHYFECVCGVHPAPETTYAGAIAAWNTRAAEAQVAALTQQLIDEIAKGLANEKQIRSDAQRKIEALREVLAWIGSCTVCLLCRDKARAALAPVAQPSAEGTEAADGK